MGESVGRPPPESETCAGAKPIGGTGVPREQDAPFAAALELARGFAAAAKSPATQRAYATDFRVFDTWCRERGLNTLPATAEVVAAFLAAQAACGKRPSTLGRRRAAIAHFHRAASYDPPTDDEKVSLVSSGIKRKIGTAPVHKKALRNDEIIAMAATGTSLRGLRNRAILLLAFAGGLRRSELVALDVEDIQAVSEGLLITIKRLGRKVGIPRGVACPVEAVKAWLDAADIKSGPIFRRIRHRERVTDRRLDPRNVANAVKEGAARLGLDPALYGAHSLRSGLVTSAIKRGVSPFKVCRQTGHRSLEMLLVNYHDDELFVGNAGEGLL
jgi:site-specific recombinase XerD